MNNNRSLNKRSRCAARDGNGRVEGCAPRPLADRREMKEHGTTRWWATVATQVLLMLALLPILDIFLHPISVLSGDYDPLINRLPEFYN